MKIELNKEVLKIRCTYSQRWRDAFTRSVYAKKERYGYIIGISRCGTCYRVKWDNTLTKDTIAICFIDIVEEKASTEVEASAIPSNQPYTFYIHPEDKIK